MWDGIVAILHKANVGWVGKTKKRLLLCDKQKAKFAARYAGVRTDVTCAFHFVVSLLQAGLLESCLRLLLSATYCAAPGFVRFTVVSTHWGNWKPKANRNASHPEQKILMVELACSLCGYWIHAYFSRSCLCFCDLMSDRIFKLRPLNLWYQITLPTLSQYGRGQIKGNRKRWIFLFILDNLRLDVYSGP
jgi:hypothetical protein